MKASKMTSLNPYATSINQKYVLAKDYNNVVDDLTTMATVLGFDASLANSGYSNQYVATGTINASKIVGNSAGTLGHANGVELVAAPGAGYVFEVVGAVLIMNFDTAAYTGGGTDLVVRTGTVSDCAAITVASLVGAASDAILQVNCLATNVALTENTNINLKATTAFTQPGTAAGILTYKVTYRVHATGL